MSEYPAITFSCFFKNSCAISFEIWITEYKLMYLTKKNSVSFHKSVNLYKSFMLGGFHIVYRQRGRDRVTKKTIEVHKLQWINYLRRGREGSKISKIFLRRMWTPPYLLQGNCWQFVWEVRWIRFFSKNHPILRVDWGSV